MRFQKLYHLLSNAYWKLVLVRLPTNKIPTSNFIIFIYLHPEFSMLTQHFSWNMKKFWHCFTIWILEVLGATIIVVMSLRLAWIRYFLDFPNIDNAFDIFLIIFTCTFVLLYHGNTISLWYLLVFYVLLIYVGFELVSSLKVAQNTNNLCY